MKKKQLHEALAVLLTKLSSAMDNPLLIDNYAVKALRTVLWSLRNLASFMMPTRSKYILQLKVTILGYVF